MNYAELRHVHCVGLMLVGRCVKDFAYSSSLYSPYTNYQVVKLRPIPRRRPFSVRQGWVSACDEFDERVRGHTSTGLVAGVSKPTI
jgi:hypothetical protein